MIGAIDGNHLEIPKPKTNQAAYINRKGYHSLLLQGVVDHRNKFIDVFCGEPGSMHDARLLRRSALYAQVLSNPNSIGPNKFIVGDTAYPSLHWLVTPFKDNGHLTREQNMFNYRLLKGRFRRLRKFDNISKQLCTEMIMVACILHNICIDANDVIQGDRFDFNQPQHVQFLSLTTHIFFIFRTDGGFMTATLAASLGAAQNLYEIALLLLEQLNVQDAL
jgi:hypothetical protein